MPAEIRGGHGVLRQHGANLSLVERPELLTVFRDEELHGSLRLIGRFRGGSQNPNPTKVDKILGKRAAEC